MGEEKTDQMRMGELTLEHVVANEQTHERALGVVQVKFVTHVLFRLAALVLPISIHGVTPTRSFSRSGNNTEQREGQQKEIQYSLPGPPCPPATVPEPDALQSARPDTR